MTEFDTVLERLKNNHLWSFPGGVHPDGQKSLSNSQPIATPPLAQQHFVPIKMHMGQPGKCLVSVGEPVLKGQPLSANSSPMAVPVHAPTSGTVSAIVEHPSAHPSGIPELTVVIDTDGHDEWVELAPLHDYTSMDAAALVTKLRDAGIAGLGGAGFPSHIKASPQKRIEFLIINGIECEPYITSDDRLMREHAWQIRQGIDILQHLIAPRHIIIAIEDNKPEAIEAMQIASQNKANCQVVSVPTVYPAGGEKQLIQVLTGREVPSGGLPEDVATSMFNVGTCYAVADAVFHGKPLIERVVTLTGDGATRPVNVWSRLGTPVSHLADYAGFAISKRGQSRIIMGGPMMGFTVASDQVPVVKITNCLLLPSAKSLRQGETERPCIRCSACSDVCPASLLPQQLYWHSKAKEYDKAQSYDLFDCIECGACAYVCPSDIPLVQYYRQAKSDIRNELAEKEKSDKAKERFETRNARLERDKQEREARHQQAAEARKAALAKRQADAEKVSADNESKPEGGKSAAVAAAIARAKAKKQQNSTSADSSAAQTSVDAEQGSGDDKKAKVAAAIARAKAKKAQVAEQDSSVAAEPNKPVTENLSQDADAQRKAKIAAAVARAKAKKAASKNQDVSSDK